MQITIFYTAQIKSITGKSDELLKLTGSSSLVEVLNERCNIYGDQFRMLIFTAEETIRPSLVISINNEQVIPGKETILKDGDEIILLSPIAGG